MDKLIKIPKSKGAEEVSLYRNIKKESKPLLDIEERRHNYDDRRAYTSYGEITKDFEDDFRCQEDELDDDDDNDFCVKPPAAAPCSSAMNIEKLKGMQRLTVTEDRSCSSGSTVTEDDQEQIATGKRLLIGNIGASNDCSRQRKQPILHASPERQKNREAMEAVGFIPHANVMECASMRRDARSAVPLRATASRMLTTGEVGLRRIVDVGETGTSHETDNLRVKSSKTLQESIRESLTINNTAAWNSQDKLESYHHKANHQIFEMNEFYINMLERLTKIRKDFGHKKVDHEIIAPTDPMIKKEFKEWVLVDEIPKPDAKTSIEICKYNTNITKQFENIEQMDQQIEKVDLQWKQMKRERLEIQKNLCEQIEQRNGVDFQKSQVFLELCASEADDSDDKIPVLENNAVVAANTDKQKYNKNETLLKKNFVKRNVEIAKNMSFPVSLTDEEKIKLDAILKEECNNVNYGESSDKNDKEDVESTIFTEEGEEIDTDHSQINEKNEYKLIEEDWDRVSEINDQIKSLSNLEENILDINNVESQLEDDAKLGKNWKYSLLDERLKEIDEQLVKIVLARETENDGSVVNEDINLDIIKQSLESIEVTI